jgi:pimeloyl-ACP methyl ester carboxylesterase
VSAPVLIVQAGGFTARQWRRLRDALTPGHRVLAPDLIGYAPDDPWPLGQPFHYARDVERLAAMLDEPTHLVGHSYGGLLVLQLALARPELARSIAVYEPVAFGVLDERDDVLASVRSLPAYRPHAEREGVDEAWLTAFVDWWNHPGAWAALPEDTRAAFRRVAWKVSQEVASLVADRTDRATYARITAPTLLLGGGRTTEAERRVLAILATCLPRARLELFPDLGHMGPITHAVEVNAAIMGHIARHDASP